MDLLAEYFGHNRSIYSFTNIFSSSMQITLRQPLKNPAVSQLFGADFKYWLNGKEVWFYKDIYKLLGHPGIDFKCPTGTPIYAAHDGVCLYAGYDETNGNMVQIWDSLNGYKTLYGHNSSIIIKQGDIIKAGQLISLSGSTGAGTGPHLHFGLKLTGNGGNGLDNNNGYNGAIDAMPFIKLDYLGNNLKNDMVFKKIKGDKNIYAVNDEKGLKLMIIDMKTFETLCAITGQEVKFEEVDNLAGYISLGTEVSIPDREIN